MIDWDQRLNAAAAGSDVELGRVITAVEAGDREAIAALSRRLAESGRAAPRIALTGSAGSGKSTLLAALSRAWPGGSRVGAVAVDPSSERSGGALLGDRYRFYRDPVAGSPTALARCFLRSMASRGEGSALSRHLSMVLSFLEEAGLSPVFIETAGAGQSDTAVTDLVDCVVLILTPDSGDVIQMLKAGLMEQADVYVVNKADLDGADRYAMRLRSVLAAQDGPGLPPLDDRVHVLQANRAGDRDLSSLIQVLTDLAAAHRRPRALLWRRAVGLALEQAVVEEFLARVRVSDAWESAVDLASCGRLTLDEAGRRLDDVHERMDRGAPAVRGES